LAVSLPQLAPGIRIDQYRIVGHLGRGGAGDVYLAEDTVLSRQVALKLLRPSASGSDLGAEARAAAAINHPNVVTVYGVGEFDDTPYLAMEYVPGPTLKELQTQGPLPEHQVRRIVGDIASALAALHARDLVHGDLTPANVLLGSDGRARVTDFGLSKRISSETLRGNAAPWSGTPPYMAPEVWSGQGSRAADIWALGVIIYEWVVGARPFAPHEGHRSALRQAVTGPAAVVAPDIDDAWEPLLSLGLACLAKRAESRPSALEVGAQLGRSVPTKGDAAPFRGLVSFTQTDAGHFFGREDEIRSVLDALATTPVTCLVGPSGAGKSSLLRAGAMARLPATQWLTLEVRPGQHAVAAFADALATAERTPSGLDVVTEDAHGTAHDDEDGHEATGVTGRLLALARRTGMRVLVAVDQTEELFTDSDGGVGAVAWLAAAGAAAFSSDTVRVALTLREDFLGQLAQVPGGRTLLGGIHVVTAPGKAGLMEALVGPLHAAGYRFESHDLAAELVENLHVNANALALLQCVGQRLWLSRDTHARLIRRDAVESMGGVDGALAAHAEEVVARFVGDQMGVVRRVCLSLVGSDGTRRKRVLDELADGEDAPEHTRHVIDRLTEGRLLVVHRPEEAGSAARIELAHDALITEWDRLAAWRRSSTETLALLESLDQSAALWTRLGRPDSGLWLGERLAEAEVRAADAALPMSEAAQRFLEASATHAERVAQRRRIIRWTAFSIIIALAAAATVTAWMYRKQQHDALQRLAESQRASAALAYERGDRVDAGARLRTALEHHDSLMGRALWWQMSRDPVRFQHTFAVAAFESVALQDHRIVTGFLDATIRIVDPVTRRWQVVRGHADQVNFIATNPSRTTLVTADISGELRRWDMTTWQSKPIAKASPGVFTLALSRDGATVVAVNRSKTVTVVKDGTTRQVTLEDVVMSVELASNDTVIVVGGRTRDSTIKLLDVESLRMVGELRGHRRHALKLVTQPGDDSIVFSGGADGEVRQWNLRTPSEPSKLLMRLPRAVRGLDLSRDGRYLATVTPEGRFRLFDLHQGTPLGALNTPGAEAVHFDGRGHAVVTAREPGTLWVIDAHRLAAQPRAPTPHRGMLGRPTAMPDGRFASVGRDGKLMLWHPRSSAPLQSHDLGRRLMVSQWIGQGRVAVGTDSGELLAVSLDSGRIDARFQGHRGAVMDLSRRGGRLVSVGWRRLMGLWRLDEMHGHVVETGHTRGVYAVSLSPDGGTIITGGSDRVLIARRWEAPKVAVATVKTLGRDQGFAIAHAPNGRVLAQTDESGTIWLWPLPLGSDSPRKLASIPDVRAYGAVWLDARRIAVGWSDRRARVFSLDRPETPVVLTGHRNEVGYLTWLGPDGPLVTASDDGTVRAFDPASGHPVWPPSPRNAAEPPRATPIGPLPEEFEALPPDALPTARTQGPSGTIAAGFDNGDVMVWSVAEGQAIATAKVHGGVVSLTYRDGQLVATSELGNTATLDLSTFEQPRCEVLRSVWAELPAIWTGRHAVRRTPPRDHNCAGTQEHERHGR